jgi:3-oxoacyl-[acyl-carrier-protein] synthase II
MRQRQCIKKGLFNITKEMDKKRIVITGIGVISPVGIGKDQYWESLQAGKSGFRPITLFDTLDLGVKIAGEITNFNAKEILGFQGLMDLDRATLLLLSAAKFALDDSRLIVDEATTHRIGVSVGSTLGNLHSVSKFDRESLTEGPRYVNPSIFPSTVGNSSASRISIRFQIKGFNATLSTGMCSALDAIDYARDAIMLGRADTVLCGSIEDLSSQTFLGFYKLKYLAGTKEKTEAISCPFDKRRNGIIFSEGAVVLVLQEFSDALKSNVKIYGEILGIGSSFDPSKFYKYNPKGEGMKEAMRSALKDANLRPEDIDCIFANANSTQDADAIETNAIKDVFGSCAYKIPITAIKSTVGEGFSVSGGFSTTSALGALQLGAIPPTINYNQKDPGCDLNYVVNKSQKKELSKVMVNTFNPGGANISLILGKFNG